MRTIDLKYKYGLNGRLTERDCKKAFKYDNGMVRFVFDIPFSELLDCNFDIETLNDYACDRCGSDYVLTDIDYRVCGFDEKSNLFIEVTGDLVNINYE